MWKCPKCDRDFKNKNQSHYCSEMNTVDEYIEQSPEEHRDTLQRVRETIRGVMPEATEKLSWKMPTFWQGKNLIQFAVHSKHLGLYPGVEAVNTFSEQLASGGFKSSKGAIQFPWNKEMPYDLIKEIALFCIEHN